MQPLGLSRKVIDTPIIDNVTIITNLPHKYLSSLNFVPVTDRHTSKNDFWGAHNTGVQLVQKILMKCSQHSWLVVLHPFGVHPQSDLRTPFFKVVRLEQPTSILTGELKDRGTLMFTMYKSPLGTCLVVLN